MDGAKRKKIERSVQEWARTGVAAHRVYFFGLGMAVFGLAIYLLLYSNGGMWFISLPLVFLGLLGLGATFSQRKEEGRKKQKESMLSFNLEDFALKALFIFLGFLFIWFGWRAILPPYSTNTLYYLFYLVGGIYFFNRALIRKKKKRK